MLIVPDIAFCALLGVTIGRATADRRGLVLAVLFGLLRFGWAPVYSLGEMKELAVRGARTDRIAREAHELVPAGGRAILVAAWDPYVFLYPRAVLAEVAAHAIACWSTLSAARTSHRLTRTGDRSFTLEPEHAPLLSSFDVLFRSQPLAVGDTFEQCGGTIRVESVDSAGRPTKLDVSYQRPLDDPKLTFLTYAHGHLAKLAFPAPGEAITLD